MADDDRVWKLYNFFQEPANLPVIAVIDLLLPYRYALQFIRRKASSGPFPARETSSGGTRFFVLKPHVNNMRRLVGYLESQKDLRLVPFIKGDFGSI